VQIVTREELSHRASRSGNMARPGHRRCAVPNQAEHSTYLRRQARAGRARQIHHDDVRRAQGQSHRPKTALDREVLPRAEAFQYSVPCFAPAAVVGAASASARPTLGPVLPIPYRSTGIANGRVDIPACRRRSVPPATAAARATAAGTSESIYASIRYPCPRRVVMKSLPSFFRTFATCTSTRFERLSSCSSKR